MTPLQLAIEECANYDAGKCKRIVIRDDGSMFRLITMPEHCVLGKRGVRCRYFEECVLPMCQRLETPNAIRARYKAEALEAEHQYRMQTGMLTDKKTSRCSCGKPREPRHRLCPECAAKHRHETFRRSQSQKRGQMSTVKAISDPENKGF